MFSTIKTTNSSILSIVKCRVQFEFRRGKEGNLWALWSITTTRAYCRLCYKEHVPYCYMKHVTVILVSCKIVIREGGVLFPEKKRQKSMACRWTTQIFQFCMVFLLVLTYIFLGGQRYNQDRHSPNNINTISSRQEMRNFHYRIFSWSNTKFSLLT